MRLSLIKSGGTSYDITGAVTEVIWRGSAEQAARSVSFSYIHAPYDASVHVPDVATGDYVSLTDEREGEVFLGQIFGVERSSQTGTITYEAYDMMKHLLESEGQYSFKNLTPEAIAAQVLADVQVPVRHLHPTGICIQSMLCDSMSLYDIILAAYGKAREQTGDKYFPMIYKRGFGMYKAEWSVAGLVLSDDGSIYESSISESMDSIKNQVKIYDATGEQVGELKDDGSIQRFGVFQAVYKQEPDSQSESGAQTLLHTAPNQTLQVSALGDINCLSCYFVTVRDSATGMAGKYWIKSDEHTFSGGVHRMRLELAYDSIMEQRGESG